MPYDYLSVGTQRLTAQGYIGPTNTDYAIRVFHITAVGSSANANVVISAVSPAGSTATNLTTPYFTLPLNLSGTNATVEWDSHYGRLMDSGAALLHTCPGFSYAVVEFATLKK